MKRTILVAVMAAAAVLVGLAAPALADGTRPYGDTRTGHIANVLHGTHRGGWLATTLDSHGYHGKRHAEIVRVHGQAKAWVGIIHVPASKAAAVHRALNPTMWLAQCGGAFVLPLRTHDDTEGGNTWRYFDTAKWAAKRLGTCWHVPK